MDSSEDKKTEETRLTAGNSENSPSGCTDHDDKGEQGSVSEPSPKRLKVDESTEAEGTSSLEQSSNEADDDAVEVETVKARLKRKEEVLDRLKKVASYKKKWSIEELRDVTGQWNGVALAAFEDLYLKSCGEKESLTREELLRHLGVDPQKLGIDVGDSARDGKGWGWDSDTSSKFFDIALTALAFLSFGVFLLNLLLNCLLMPTSMAMPTAPLTNPDPILTMITGNTGGAIVTGRFQNRRPRSRRYIFSPEIDHSISTRRLIAFVTNSIETMTQKHECVPRLFCEGNKQSRVMGKVFRVLFPVVSIGMSYIGKLLRLHDDLEAHFNAIVLGASEANCITKFPECKS